MRSSRPPAQVPQQAQARRYQIDYLEIYRRGWVCRIDYLELHGNRPYRAVPGGQITWHSVGRGALGWITWHSVGLSGGGTVPEQITWNSVGIGLTGRALELGDGIDESFCAGSSG
jgi:hypothetical protein